MTTDRLISLLLHLGIIIKATIIVTPQGKSLLVCRGLKKQERLRD